MILNFDECQHVDELVAEGVFDQPLDDTFKATLSEQEKFRYEVLVFMKKSGYKLINSKCFKKKDIYIPVNMIEDFYSKHEDIDLRILIEKSDGVNIKEYLL
jgi:hypothetical protein